VSPNSKICCAPKWGACTYVTSGSWCSSADPAALAAIAVVSPWLLTKCWQPSASARFPLTVRSVPLNCKVGSPYTTVTSTYVSDLIQVHFVKESSFIAQQRRYFKFDIHTYIRTYIHTYIHSYIHTYVHTYTHIHT